tara:strand:+ start:137 stop:1237 length:1101 start_codon:yes stop_codon:yes gene_type:complete
MAYLGQGAEGNFTTTNAKDTFSGDGSETTFTLSQRGTENNVDVFVNNVRQEPGVAYNIEGNGTSLVFTAAPSTGTNNIYVVNRGPAELSASHPAAQNLEAADGTFTGDLTVDTSTLKVDSTNNRVGIGTINPSQALTVNGAGARIYLTGANEDIDMDGSANGQIQIDGNGYTGAIALNANGLQIYNNSAGRAIIFGTNETERMRILSGGGLTFNGDTAAANALDDYEEGTWTPTYSGSTTNPTVSYTEQHGEYVKIGRQVIARLELKTSSFSGGSGIVTVGGLPFTTTSNDGARSGNLIVGYSQGFASTTHAPQTGYANQNTTSIVLGHRASDTGANAELSGTFAMSNLHSSGNNFLMATLIYTAA